MKTTMLAIILCMISTVAFGQNLTNITAMRAVKTFKTHSLGPDDFKRYKGYNDIKGSPFYNQDWRTGFVLLNPNARTHKLKLKYDSYNNVLLFKRNGKTLEALPFEYIGFVFTGLNKNTLFLSGFQSNKYNITPGQLLRVIYNGNVKLLAKEYTKLYSHKNLFKNKMVSEFESGRKYFLVTPNGIFHKIKLKTDDILKFLSHKKEVKKYANKYHLNFGNEIDLKNILKYYDSITKKS